MVALREPRTMVLPSQLGMPPKFEAYRDHQLQTALDIASSDKRFSCLSAPTGTGKSPLLLTVARLLNARTLVLTATKNLQNQLNSDFSSLIKDIRGQQNYPCVALERGGILEGYGQPGASCSDGPCKVGVFCWLKKAGGCGYYDAIAAASQAKIVVTNYALWLSLARHSDPTLLGHFDLLIADESHNAPSVLTDFCAVELNRDEIRTLLNLKLPPVDEGIEVWSAWARDTAHTASLRINQLRDQLKSSYQDRRALTKQLLRLSSIHRDLEEMAAAGTWKRTDSATSRVKLAGEGCDWIAFETDKGAKFSPIWAHAYSEQYLFRGIKKVVLSSGTLLPSIKKRLGIDEAECDWHEVPSAFDPKRRPIIYVPTVKMDARAVEGQHRLWARRTDEIIEPRLDRKTLIHSVSYARADEIKQRSKFGRYMLTHDSRSAKQAIERFKRAKPPCILVSPAMVEGVDFPDEELRCIIVPKVPFASAVSDPVFKARCKQDPNYRFECAALLIVQMIGRGMRSVDDWMEAFITDDHFGYLRWKVNWMQWFKAAWREESRVPPPLQLAVSQMG